jgi:hypothetical protein
MGKKLVGCTLKLIKTMTKSFLRPPFYVKMIKVVKFGGLGVVWYVEFNL